MIGKTISHYKIIEKIGEGGMGVVYKAQDIKLDRVVALKFLPQYLASDPIEKERFFQEAKATSALSHPNILTIHDLDEYDGQFFISMEYLEGQTLKSKIQKEKLRIEQIIDFGLQIAEALKLAHDKSIIHRDLKSDNLMVLKDGRVKIMDFGLAKWKKSPNLTKTGTTVGTLNYMSPEQVQGITVDHRTDLWSFGVVLYEMLTGQLPFQGDYEAATIYSIINEEPLPISGRSKDAPESLNLIMERALKKDLSERYQDVKEVLNDLKQTQKELKQVSRNLTPQKSIAVLPLDNISPDKENEYFSDGLTEEIIMNLSKIKDLKVISRTSAMHYKGTKKPLKQIAKELQVQYILEGSVRKHGPDLRITAQLIDAVQDSHLWAERYNGTVEDVFEIQEKVAGEIAEALKLKLSPPEQRNIERRQTKNPEAYQLYLMGRFYWNKRTEESFKTAVGYFNQAIELDPNYALPLVGLADTHILTGVYCYQRPHVVMPKARQAAQKALELDNELAEAHASLAHIKMLYDWDWAGAESEFKQAIGLTPNYAPAYLWYSLTLSAQGKLEEALIEIKKAQELDPLSLIINTDVGLVHYFAGRYDLAIRELLKALEMDPNFFVTRLALAMAYEQVGKFEEAIAEVKRALSLSQDSTLLLAALGQSYAVAGKKEKAQEVLAKLHEISKVRFVSPYSIAHLYTSLGDKEQALVWLQKAYEERILFIIHALLKVDPSFRILHSEPGYIELLKKVGLDK